MSLVGSDCCNAFVRGGDRDETAVRPSVRLPRKIVFDLDELVERGVYFSRSDLIREGVRAVLLGNEGVTAPNWTAQTTVAVRVTPQMWDGVESLTEQNGYDARADVLRAGVAHVLEKHDDLLGRGGRR